MKIHVVAIGTKMPSWVTTGVEEYTKRLPPANAVQFHELPLPKRGPSSDLSRLIQQEGMSMMKLIPEQATIIALDERGSRWNTADLAQQLEKWNQQGKPVYCLIGGPDGLSDECKSKAHATWSLSPLTLPHPIVRVILAEAIYRAWSVNQGHPYHRE